MTIEETTRAAAGSGPGDPVGRQMMIGGPAVGAAEGRTFEIPNPATGRVIATAPLGGREAVDRAVAGARKAFDDPRGWASWSATKRGRALAKPAAIVREHINDLADLETRNGGKPARGAKGQILCAAVVFEYS